MIGSDYEVLSPVRRQVIIWIYVELIFIWLLWENVPEIRNNGVFYYKTLKWNEVD